MSEQVVGPEGDDVGFWLRNPLMTPEMLEEKVHYWIAGAWDQGFNAGSARHPRTEVRRSNPYRANHVLIGGHEFAVPTDTPAGGESDE